MARGSVGPLARLLEGGSVAGLTDGQLLDRFATRGGAGAEAAFEALVTRHGPMVARVCRQSLRDPHDVEDAFQATFLVLVRRADAIGERDLLGPWLYGVAHRVARKARAVAGKRRGREGGRAGFDPPARLDPSARVDVDLAPVLHEEVNRLPAKYRQPVILCHLQGLTHAEAAHELAWPVGTVSVRLARARKILADRLTRRGITTGSVATVSATLTAEASAALVPASWIHAVAIAALATSTGLPLTTAVSVGALALARRTSMTMFLSPWKWFAIPATVALTTATGVAIVGSSSPGPAADPQQPPAPAVARPDPDDVHTPAVEFFGPGPVIERKSDGVQELEADNMVIDGKVGDLAKMVEALQKSDPTATYQLRLSGGKVRYGIAAKPPADGSKRQEPTITHNLNPQVNPSLKLVDGRLWLEGLPLKPDGSAPPPKKEEAKPAADMLPVAVPPAIVGPDGQGELGDVPPDYFNIPAPTPGTPGSPRPVQIGQKIQIEVLEALPARPIRGVRIVRDDGTISLGFYGDLYVVGLNRDQIKAKVIERLRVYLNDNLLGLVGYESPNKAVAIPLDRNNRVFIDDQPTAEVQNEQGDKAQVSASQPKSPQPGSGAGNAPQAKGSTRPAEPNPALDSMTKFMADHPNTPDYYDLAKLPKREGIELAILQPGQTIQVEVLEALPGRPITGPRVIRPDGTISLGFYGDLKVAGLNRDQIKVKLLEHLDQFLPPELLGLYVYEGANLELRMVPAIETNRVFIDETMNFAPANEDLRAQIQALSAKIDRLTGSAPNPTPGPPASPSSTP